MTPNQVHALIKEIQGIAQAGLSYSTDPYDQDRYQRLRKVSFQLMSAISDCPLEAFERFFLPDRGYSTPKVDVRACIIRDDQVLLVQERSDGKWTLPGGWADQNDSPMEGIKREVKEESGFDVEIKNLYAIKDRDRHAYLPKYPVSVYKLFFTASILGGAPHSNLEISQVEFFSVGDLPPLSMGRTLPEDVHLGYQHYRDPAALPRID